MSFWRAARAALVWKKQVLGISSLLGVVVFAALLVSCAGDKQVPVFGQHQNAYVTLPGQNSVLLMQINTITGEMTSVGQTPQILGTAPQGLALMNKFLYVANTQANSISLFNIATDGSLSQSGPATPTASGPYALVIDPTGKYLLVSNSLSGNVSVFSIDSSSGALTAVAGSPFFTGGQNPGEMLMPASGDLLYVSDAGSGIVTAFTFSNTTGVLTRVGSPNYSGAGAAGLAVDSSGSYLYVANASAVNNPPNSIGNISGFNINRTAGPSYGSLSAITGSPFTSIAGSGPTHLVLASNGNFLFATTSGAAYSVWAFSIGETGALTPTINSPFSVQSGNLFALIDSTGGFLYIGSSTGIQGYTYDQNTGQPTIVTDSPFSTNGTSPGKMVISP
jgi:hypothetical protein